MVVRPPARPYLMRRIGVACVGIFHPVRPTPPLSHQPGESLATSTHIMRLPKQPSQSHNQLYPPPTKHPSSYHSTMAIPLLVMHTSNTHAHKNRNTHMTFTDHLIRECEYVKQRTLCAQLCSARSVHIYETCARCFRLHNRRSSSPPSSKGRHDALMRNRTWTYVVVGGVHVSLPGNPTPSSPSKHINTRTYIHCLALSLLRLLHEPRCRVSTPVVWPTPTNTNMNTNTSRTTQPPFRGVALLCT